MSLIERAHELQRLSEQYDSRRRAAEQQAVWVQSANDLKVAVDRLRSPMAFLKWASTRPDGPRPGTPEPKLATASTVLENLSAVVADDPASLLRGDGLGNVRAAVRAVESAAEALATRAASVWTSMQASAAWEDAALWTAFRQHPDHRAAVARLEQLDEIWRRLVQKPYLDSDIDRDRFVAVMSERGTLSLPPIDDARIRRFMADVQVGVSLAKIDDYVMAWLRDNGLLDSYVVRRR